MSSGTQQLSRPVRALYKTLLRTARVFDANPALKSLVYLPEFHDRVLGKTSTAANADASQSSTTETKQGHQEEEEKTYGNDVRAVAEYAASFVQGKPYLPQDGSLYRHIRHAFRDKLIASRYEHSELLNAAFTAQSALLRTASIVRAISSQPQFQVRDLQGVTGSLEHTQTVELGTLMIEHPALGLPGRAVSLVYDMDQRHPEADGDSKFQVRGFTVNRPLPYQAKEVVNIDLDILGDLPIWQGGLDTNGLYIMHRFSDIKDAIEICPGVCVGGQLDQLTEKLRSGEAEPTDFKLLLGCTIWESEGEEYTPPGMDHYIYAKGSAVAHFSLMPQVGFDYEPDDPVTAAQLKDQERGGYEHEKYLHQNTTWKAALGLLGPTFESFAELHPVTSMLLLELHENPSEYEINTDPEKIEQTQQQIEQDLAQEEHSHSNESR